MAADVNIEVKVRFVVEEVDGLELNNVRLTRGTTIAQAKVLVALAWQHKPWDPGKARERAKLLRFERLGVQLLDTNTVYFSSLVDGATVVVKGLESEPLRPRRAPPAIAHVSIPLGAVVVAGAGSGESICNDIRRVVLDFAGGDVEAADGVIGNACFLVADGAAPPQAAAMHLEAHQAELASTGVDTRVAVGRWVCTAHIFHDAFLEVCVELSVACPVWQRGSHNSVLIWTLEQLSTTMHNHHVALGLQGFLERVSIGCETRWNGYSRVAAGFAMNHVQIAHRVHDYLSTNGCLESGGGDLGNAARLVLWAASDRATILLMHVLAEAARVIITPVLSWMQEKDSRRLLEFPKYLRERLAVMLTLADCVEDYFPVPIRRPTST